VLLLNPFTFDFSTVDLKVLFAALALILTGIGVFYFTWWKNRKRLSYEILSNVLLISTDEEIQDKVEVLYEGQRVKNVRLLVIKLVNDGHVPIKKDDFDKPVKFIFPNAKILTADKLTTYPENLGITSHYRNDWLEMDPALFNRKDYVQFKLLLNDYQSMKIDARIIGVSAIRKVRPRLLGGDSIFILPFLAAGVYGGYRFFTRAGTVTDEADRTLYLLALSVVTMSVLWGVARIINKYTGDNEN
jgi:hypothetical protein